MNLGKYITSQLYRLSTEGPSEHDSVVPDTEGGQRVSLRQEEYDIQVRLSNQDRHSAELHGLQVVMVQPTSESADVRTLAQRAIARLSYLEEPLDVWELEEPDMTAQLRSMPPQRESDSADVTYWEVLIQQAHIATGVETTASIQRYSWRPGLPRRETVPYPATYALLGRLSESLTLKA